MMTLIFIFIIMTVLVGMLVAVSNCDGIVAPTAICLMQIVAFGTLSNDYLSHVAKQVYKTCQIVINILSPLGMGNSYGINDS